jgi:hypothetical protein
MDSVMNVFYRTGKLLTRRPEPVNRSGAPGLVPAGEAEPSKPPVASMPIGHEHLEACLVHVEGAFDDARAQAGAYSRESRYYRRYRHYRVLTRLARLCRAAAGLRQ